MTLQSYDLITREQGDPLERQSADLDLLLSSVGIGSSQILVAETAFKILKVFGKLRVEAGVGPTDAVVKDQLDIGLGLLQSQLDILVSHLSSIDGSLVSMNGKIGTSQGGVDSLYSIVDRLCSGVPLEETFTATEGQTIFNASTMTWTNDNAVFDILVFRDGSKMQQGSTSVDYRKTSTSQIVFFNGLRANTKITIRQNIPWSVVTAFINYINEVVGLTVPIGALYNQGTNQLAVYRNGLYMIFSSDPSLGFPSDRYTESHRYAVTLEVEAVYGSFFIVMNRSIPPISRQAINGLTGFSLTVPAYTLGDKSLLIYRGGMLLNASALGDNIMQYSEDDTTHITVLETSTTDSLWIIELLASAPTWRQDITGITGATLTFTGSYVLGSKRLSLYKNGTLMMNTSDTSLGADYNRYVEATVNTVTLESASVVTDVWSALYI